MYINFSDGAKFADIARTWINSGKYGQSFSFWNTNLVYPFSSAGTPPLMPFSISLLFRILGVGDLAVIATSFIYFLLSLLFVFLLAKKIFNNKLIAWLSTFGVAFNYDLINYARNGASESPLVFEIVASLYFLSLKKKWANFVGLGLLILMYFTRPQAFIYIAGAVLYFLLSNYKLKKAVILFLAFSLCWLTIDHFIFPRFPNSNYLYSVTARGLQAAEGYSSGKAVSDALRGSGSLGISQNLANSRSPLINLAVKVFYNLYNFYKLMPLIMNPYLFALFILGIFRWTKSKIYNSFKFATIFMFGVTLLVTALSIPFLRYIHPVIPLVYILAVETIVWIIGVIFKKEKIIAAVSALVIIFLAVGPELGILLLDSRFERNTHNVGKPPVFVVLAWTLRDNTNKSQTVLTNLDTWGSWYGERKTVWFPLKPNQLIDKETGKIPFDAIYLTSYRTDDQNYYMGDEWKQIFNNPSDPKKWQCDGCLEIGKEFKFIGEYKISALADYENQDASAILLVKK